MKLERKTFKAETKVSFRAREREREEEMCISREEIGGQLSRRKRVSRYIYIIPIAKVLISHFRYNERLAGLKLRQTYLTWPISKHFPGKNRGTIRSSRKPKLVFLEFQLDYR